MCGRGCVFSRVNSVLILLANRLSKRHVLSVFSLPVQLSNLVAQPVGRVAPRSARWPKVLCHCFSARCAALCCRCSRGFCRERASASRLCARCCRFFFVF